MSDVVNRLRKKLADAQRVLIDGATGTELEARGATMHPKVWCATATATDPDTLKQIHMDYIGDGVDLITTNTFSSNRNMMGPAGLGDQVAPLNTQATQIALDARATMNADDHVVVAGSMSHQIPVKKGTDKRDARLVPDSAVARTNFEEIASLLQNAGVDMFLMEMMSDLDLTVPAIETALATGLPVWVGLSARLAPDGEVRSYSCPDDYSFEEVVKTCVAVGGEAFGIMHCNHETVTAALPVLRKHWDGPLMAYPDMGHFEMPNWIFDNDLSPVEFAALARAWEQDFRVQVFGGCCGLGRDYIKALM